jgi:D-alanyl-lipoteichoic acid acyltransferase DltB (MBOAT superfamily)
MNFDATHPMFFTSLLFWVFFVGFLGFYTLFVSRNKLRNGYLLIVSLFLYFKVAGGGLVLLLFSCLLNYAAGRWIATSRKPQPIVIAAVSINLLLLAFYKYSYFATDCLNQLFAAQLKPVNWINVAVNQILGQQLDKDSIILPIGISFYTFQAISYLADVYKHRIKPVNNLADFSFYLSFFPQLVAGPIVRAHQFVPQLYQKFRLSRNEFSYSVYLIVKGLFKKMMIADFLAVNFVDRIFEAPLAHSGVENLAAVYAYALQIYCDFSGYTDIAIGLALMLGFKIPVNFNQPYQARCLTDFWRRWHISLSFWLRDYLYIPLGGNRNGRFRMHLNLMITMLLGGLWHGANLRFLLWGAIHGIGLSLEKIIQQFQKPPKARNWFRKALSVFFTFQLVSLAWIFFRLETMDKVRQFFYQVSQHFATNNWVQMVSAYQHIEMVLLLGFMMIWLPIRWKEKIRGWFISMPVPFQILVSALILLGITFISQSALQPFIYFQF